MVSVVSVCLSVHRGSPCDHHLDLFKLVQLVPPYSSGLTIQYSPYRNLLAPASALAHPRHLQTCSLGLHHTPPPPPPPPRISRKVDGWHLTEIPSHWRIQGGRQGRAPPPPRGSKFFHFHAVFGKKLKNNSIFGSWRPPLGKILDPPLLLVFFFCNCP